MSAQPPFVRSTRISNWLAGRMISMLATAAGWSPGMTLIGPVPVFRKKWCWAKTKAKSTAAESSQRQVLRGLIGLFAAPQPDQAAEHQNATRQSREQSPLRLLQLRNGHHDSVFFHRPRANAFEQLGPIEQPVNRGIGKIAVADRQIDPSISQET